MATRISLTYRGMDGSGATVKEARRDAARKIEAALGGSYEPQVLAVGDCTAILFRRPSGWTYGLVHAGMETICAGFGGNETREEVERRARKHVAEVGWNRHNDREVLAFVHADDRRELERWMRWQRDYDFARREGKDDEQAREYAHNQRGVAQGAEHGGE